MTESFPGRRDPGPRHPAAGDPTFLIVRFSAIGDCVMAAHAVTAIRLKHPNARIVWAVEPFCVPVLDTARLVDDIVECPRRRWKEARWSPATWRDQLRTYLSLRRYRPDIALDFQGHSKTALAVRLSGAKRRLAVDATDAFARRLVRPSNLTQGKKHWVERHQALLAELGDYPFVTRPIVPELFEERGRVAEERPAGPVATLSVGSSEEDKRYPISQWRTVAESLLAHGVSVVALGGPGDPPIETPGTLDRIGKTGLRESMAWIAASDVHLAADTGTGHIAAAYSVPVVSVFGRTNPAKFRPYTDQGTALRAPSKRPGDVSPSEVVAAALSWLEGACPGS
ncbi:MAG: glycosyltransferase family 9 protein [Fimbriimonadaceae bacterium]|nr:glycosyltransferase family 9 protein [Fimbriimonadaceae bacterium]